MTPSDPTYDGSDDKRGNDETCVVAGQDRASAQPEREVCTHAGCAHTQLELSKCGRSMQDVANDIVKAPVALRPHFSRLPFPTSGVQNRQQYVNSVQMNQFQLSKLQRGYQNKHTLPQASGLTDVQVLPSQRQRRQDLFPGVALANATVLIYNHTDAQVQPTDNPYHWEVPVDAQNNISSWVKASWIRSNEIVRQQAGTLKRNVALRRSHKKRVIPKTDDLMNAVSTMLTLPSKRNTLHHNHAASNIQMHRSFSFESQERPKSVSRTWKPAEEEVTSKPSSVTRIDSPVEHVSEGRSTRFREELDEPPCIARTFSEILGSEPFVPTALLDNE